MTRHCHLCSIPTHYPPLSPLVLVSVSMVASGLLVPISFLSLLWPSQSSMIFPGLSISCSFLSLSFTSRACLSLSWSPQFFMVFLSLVVFLVSCYCLSFIVFSLLMLVSVSHGHLSFSWSSCLLCLS
jgi:hypothetical protein